MKNQKIQLEKDYIESNQVFPIGSKVCITVMDHERILVPEAKRLAYIADYEIDDNYCALLDLGIGQCFVNRGKVTEIKTEEEKK